MNDTPTLNPPAVSGTRLIEKPTMLTLRIVEELERQRKAGGPLQKISIPPCPDLLVRLQAALAKAEPDTQEVARIANADVAMAATLLRNANSVLYASTFGGGPPVRTVGAAMDRLGLDLTATLLTEVLLKQAIRAEHPRLRGFWDQAALRAAALEHISRQLPGTTPDLARLYGLFCHVGVVVLMQSMPGYSGTLAEAGARKDKTMTEIENANHRTDHAVVGALVARVWGVAPQVIAALKTHHDLGQLGKPTLDPEVSTLLAMGLLAEDAMRRRLQIEREREYTQHLGAALAWLQLAESDLADWDEGLQAALDGAL
jgi:HD-like signal output (HDOD) protein